MSPILELLVVASANVIGAGMAVPQAVRLVRTRRVDGVSRAWAAMSVTVNGWWIAYGIGARSWGVLPVTLVSVAAYFVVVTGLHRFDPSSRRRTVRETVAPAFVLGLLPIVALRIGGWPAVGVTLGTVYAVQLLPAVVTAYRSADVSGIAAGTWVLAWIEAALWGVYGLPRADVGMLSLAVTGTVMSSLVIARLAWKRPRPVGGGALAPIGV
ncbi:MAG: hypothetical protein R2705_05215 [Ilumatobacteraceae bacterium]